MHFTRNKDISLNKQSFRKLLQTRGENGNQEENFRPSQTAQQSEFSEFGR